MACPKQSTLKYLHDGKLSSKKQHLPPQLKPKDLRRFCNLVLSFNANARRFHFGNSLSCSPAMLSAQRMTLNRAQTVCGSPGKFHRRVPLQFIGVEYSMIIRECDWQGPRLVRSRYCSKTYPCQVGKITVLLFMQKQDASGSVARKYICPLKLKTQQILSLFLNRDKAKVIT